MPHEINVLFDAAGLPLAPKLREMLDEHASHRTERRGCGYTQATRFLATGINQPPDPLSTQDLDVFAGWPQRETRMLAAIAHEAGWPRGWRALHQAPAHVLDATPAMARDALAGLTPTLQRLAAQAALPESRLLIAMIEQLLTRDAPPASADVAGMPIKPNIGSCSQAEEFFLEIAHGRVRRGGSVNVIVAANGEPLMLEKMKLGESHSAIVIAPIRMHGVGIPPGGLCALEHLAGAAPGAPTAHGMRIPLDHLAQARFLRLTTLTLPPGERQRAFSAQVDAQVRSRMLSPLTTILSELQDFARGELRHRTA